jgi:AraC-like DNA-binding protein
MATLERFSTLGLQHASRVELWEEHNARALVALECRTLNESPLEATETNLQFGRLHFAHVAANPHVVERSSRHIAKTPTDGIALYFTLFGESFFYYKDGVHLQRPGGLLVCDVNEPFMRGFAQGLEEFAVRVPRSVFNEITDAPLPSSPMTMTFSNSPGANANAAALARLVRTTLASASDPDLVHTGEVAMGLLRAIFSEDEARSSSAHRRAALAYVDRHLRDPRLSVAQVAHEIGVSERQLSRVFGETGTGLARTILERRLDLARRILTSQDSGNRSVGEVAAYCGFSSHSHFTRVFRERFEESPGAARRA